MNLTNRLQHIDFLKGVLLILICLSHFSNLPSFIRVLTNPTASYWVPIFFIISGLLSINSKKTLKESFIRKTRTLLLPYFIFSLLFIIIDPNIYSHKEILYKNIERIFLEGIGSEKASPLWFLFVLYFASLLHAVIIKTTSLIQLACACILSIIAYFLSYYQITLFFQLNIIISATVYMTAGSFLGHLLKSHPSPHKLTLLPILIIGISGLLIPLGDFHLNRISIYPLFYLCSIVFTYLLLILLKSIDIDKYNNTFFKYISYIAKNGIIILSVHCYLIIIYNYVTKPIPTWINFILEFCFVFGSLYLFIVPFFNHYAYKIIGKNKIAWIKNYNI